MANKLPKIYIFLNNALVSQKNGIQGETNGWNLKKDQQFEEEWLGTKPRKNVDEMWKLPFDRDFGEIWYLLAFHLNFKPLFCAI